MLSNFEIVDPQFKRAYFECLKIFIGKKSLTSNWLDCQTEEQCHFRY